MSGKKEVRTKKVWSPTSGAVSYLWAASLEAVTGPGSGLVSRCSLEHPSQLYSDLALRRQCAHTILTKCLPLKASIESFWKTGSSL